MSDSQIAIKVVRNVKRNVRLSLAEHTESHSALDTGVRGYLEKRRSERGIGLQASSAGTYVHSLFRRFARILKTMELYFYLSTTSYKRKTPTTRKEILQIS